MPRLSAGHCEVDQAGYDPAYQQKQGEDSKKI